MNRFVTRLLSRGLPLALLSGLLTSCFYGQAQMPDPEKKAAITLAQRFLTDLDAGNGEDLIAISAVPFWGDGDYLAEQEAFEKVARKEASRADQRLLGFRASHVMPFAEIEALDTDLYQKVSRKMDTEGLFAVFLAVEFKGYREDAKPRTDSLIILVRQDRAGAWRVVGIDD